MAEGNQVFPSDQASGVFVIEFPSFRDFIEAYSPLVSDEGMFIRDDDVADPVEFSEGDRVTFEVRLKDDFRLIQGGGVVLWNGPDDIGGGSGTAIRFVDVDEPSQRLISRLVANYAKDGGVAFDVDKHGAMPSTSELTAETLKASEADALFASEEPEAEAVSDDPVEVQTVEPDAPAIASPSDAVGLETISIPTGLIGELPGLGPDASNTEDAAAPGIDTPGEDSPEQDAADSGRIELPEVGELPVGPLLGETEASTEASDAEPLAGETMASDAEALAGETEASDAEPLLGGGEVSDAEATLDAVADELPSAGMGVTASDLLSGVGDDLEDPSLLSAADSVSPISGLDIAKVADEISNVHRYDLPEVEVGSSAGIAGAASAGSDGNFARKLAAPIAIAVLLGAGAFYFGDTVKGWLGFGDDDVAPVETVSNELGTAATRESMGEASPARDRAEEGGLSVSEDSGSAEQVADSSATAAPVGAEVSDESTVSEADPAFADAGDPVAVNQPAADSVEPVTSPAAEVPAETPPARPAEATRPLPQPAAAPVATGRRVERISWEREGDATVVTVLLNREVSATYFEVLRVREGNPREVIKIRGVDSAYSPNTVQVGSPHIQQLRTGLHRGADGSALHIVADLTGAAVTILSVEPQGRELKITFS